MVLSIMIIFNYFPRNPTVCLARLSCSVCTDQRSKEHVAPARSTRGSRSISVRMLSKKRKVDSECRVFQEKWKEKYLFWEVGGKPVCLICSQQVAVPKEYNIRRHYETHQEKYNEYTGPRRAQKLNELASSLRKQQSAFSKCRETYEGSF